MSVASGKYINEQGDTIIDGINIDERVKQVCLSDTLIKRIKTKDHLSEMDYFMLGMALH